MVISHKTSLNRAYEINTSSPQADREKLAGTMRGQAGLSSEDEGGSDFQLVALEGGTIQ